MGANRILLLDAARLRPSRLARCGDLHVAPLEAIQRGCQETQMLDCRDVAVDEKEAVAGMIEFAVEAQELLVGQGRNVFGVSARVAA